LYPGDIFCTILCYVIYCFLAIAFIYCWVGTAPLFTRFGLQ